MFNESKQNLISLSLAGAIGYYIYSKLLNAKIENGISNQYEPAEERSKKELSWRPNINDELYEPTPEEIIPENVENDIESETIEEPETINEPEEDISNEIFENDNSDTQLSSILDDEPTDEELNDFDTPELNLEIEDAATNNDMPELDGFAADLSLEEEIEKSNETPEIISELEPDDTDINIEDLNDSNGETSVDELFDAVSDSAENDNSDIVKDDNALNIEGINLPSNNDDCLLPNENTLNDELKTDDLNLNNNNETAASIENKPQVMQNTEALHKIDNADENAKAEYKSIMDFFNSL